MTERQRNYWLRACTEAKAFVTLHESELKQFKELEGCFNYIKSAKVNDLATYLKHHPKGDVCNVVLATMLSGAGIADHLIIKSLNDLSSILKSHVEREVKEMEAKGIGENLDVEGGAAPND